MDRPAMLVDIMWPLLSVLEANQDAPMREAIAWELQLADATDDAVLRDAYADRLQQWGCAKREADVRREADGIRQGKPAQRRRHSPLIGLRHPEGYSNLGTDDNPLLRENSDLAREILDSAQMGSALTLPNYRDNYGDYAWDVIPYPGSSVEVNREGD